MIYIKRIVLKNFQSHTKTDIELSPNLNVIIGPSDSGKTSILRAIKWVLYNEPTGDSFIQKGKTECSVRLFFNNGLELERYRTASKNQYIVKRNDIEEIYQGFGVNVPEEVQAATGIRKINLDSKLSSSINLSEQLEGSFLLSESDSIKASSIGRLVGVNLIDDALRKSLSDLRQIKNTNKSLLEKKEELEKELDSFAYLESYELNLNKLKDISQDLENKNKVLNRLNSLRQTYIELKKELKSYDIRLEKLKNIGELELDILKIETSFKDYSLLSTYRSRLRDIDNRSKAELAKMEKLKNIDNLDISLISSKLENLFKLKNLKARYNKILIYKEVDLKTLNNLKTIESAEQILDNLYTEIYKYEQLSTIDQSYKDKKARISKGIDFYNHLKYIESNDILNKKIENNLIKLKGLKKAHSELLKIRIAMDKDLSLSQNLESETKELLGKYRNLLEEQEICPYCFSVISEEHINKVIKDYEEES